MMFSSVSADMTEPHESFKEEPLSDSRRLDRRREALLLGAGSPFCIPILSGSEDSVDKKESTDFRRDDALGGTVSPVFIPTLSVKRGGISFAKKFCSDGCLVKALLVARALFGVPMLAATPKCWSIFWPGSV